MVFYHPYRNMWITILKNQHPLTLQCAKVSNSLSQCASVSEKNAAVKCARHMHTHRWGAEYCLRASTGRLQQIKISKKQTNTHTHFCTCLYICALSFSSHHSFFHQGPTFPPPHPIPLALSAGGMAVGNLLSLETIKCHSSMPMFFQQYSLLQQVQKIEATNPIISLKS